MRNTEQKKRTLDDVLIHLQKENPELNFVNLSTLNHINVEALHDYFIHHTADRALFVITKLCIYAIENKDNIHLGMDDTDALKGLAELLFHLNDSRLHSLTAEKIQSKAQA